ncbi:CRISPR system precrRNA processing endoribonuclease RAMP protein Cas6 [Campylobacter sp. RM15925]|uniref:CRISPR system precrRNA processing endoribonuclease RAMP protein Cas6 n=1 Tax=Campylobacter sp. RM15925 TaxID=1705724 RepID=UPI0014735E05|nr:CRISPR system precrRNA processing endoribonuclease RAMP protein Cas6 [Campylobacter sp. RM15925]
MKYSEVRVVFKSVQKPPFFIGSQIRGAFGYALKSVSCINPSYKCDECFAKDSCLYYDFFEQKNSYHKYRLDFKLGVDFYDFGIFLLGDISEKLPYIASAVYIMLKKNGLGKDRVKYDNFDIFVNGKACFKDDKISLPKEYTNDFISNEYFSDLKINFITPLRIKKDNKFLKNDKICLKDILNSIYQRKMKILGKGFEAFPYDIKGEVLKSSIKYIELTRHSNRQNTNMNMGGLIGHVEINGINKDCLDLLKLGEIIGVGKQTVFGLGKIEVENING